MQLPFAPAGFHPSPPAARAGIWRAGATGLIAAAALIGITAMRAAAQAPTMVAVYVEAQAARGRQVYFRACANCHGDQLEGKVGPPLVGRQFHQMAAAQQMTAPSLFQFIAKQMPQTSPGSLTQAQYQDVFAFILKQNGYPAGDTPFAPGNPDLQKIDLAAATNGSG